MFANRYMYFLKKGKLLNIVALFSGFIGACCAYADSWRTATRFSIDGVNLGYGPELMTWWWRNCGQIGFILIALAFALELFVFLTDQR